MRIRYLIFSISFICIFIHSAFTQVFQTYITDSNNITYYLNTEGNSNHLSLYKKIGDEHFYTTTLYSQIHTNKPIIMNKLPLISEVEPFSVNTNK